MDLPARHQHSDTSQRITIPPPSVKVVEIEVEVGGSIRIKLEADSPTTRKFSSRGSTLSASVVTGGIAYAGSLDYQKMEDLIDALSPTTSTQTTSAYTTIILRSPDDQPPADDLGQTYEMVQVIGELLCLEQSGTSATYIGTQNIMVTAYHQANETPRIHASTHGPM